MENYTHQLEERLSRNTGNIELVAVTVEPRTDDQTSQRMVTGSRMPVMIMNADCASGTVSDWHLADVVRDVMCAGKEKVIVVEEAWNSVVVAAGLSTLQSTAVQLRKLASKVANKVTRHTVQAMLENTVMAVYATAHRKNVKTRFFVFLNLDKKIVSKRRTIRRRIFKNIRYKVCKLFEKTPTFIKI